MGCSSGYDSPKAGSQTTYSLSSKSSSYESSKSRGSVSTKSSSYDSTKTSSYDEPKPTSRLRTTRTPKSIKSSSLTTIKNLVTKYIEVTAAIEEKQGEIKQLQEKKAELDVEIASHPDFEMFQSLISSIGDTKKKKR